MKKMIIALAALALAACSSGGGGGGGTPGATCKVNCDTESLLPSASKTILEGKDDNFINSGITKRMRLTVKNAAGTTIRNTGAYYVALGDAMTIDTRSSLMTQISDGVYEFDYTPPSDSGVNWTLFVYDSKGVSPQEGISGNTQDVMHPSKLQMAKLNVCGTVGMPGTPELGPLGLRRFYKNSKVYDVLCGYSDLLKLRSANGNGTLLEKAGHIWIGANIDATTFYSGGSPGQYNQQVLEAEYPAVTETHTAKWGSKLTSDTKAASIGATNMVFTRWNGSAWERVDSVEVEGNGFTISGIKMFLNYSEIDGTFGRNDFLQIMPNADLRNLTISGDGYYSGTYGAKVRPAAVYGTSSIKGIRKATNLTLSFNMVDSSNTSNSVPRTKNIPSFDADINPDSDIELAY